MSDKRTQLIEATVDLFSKEGFWNTSTARISKHAQVATGTLFNYFPSKEALIDAVYLQLKKEVRDFVLEAYPERGELRERMDHIWDHYAMWAVANPVRYRLLEQLRLSDLVSQAAIDKMEEELAFMFEVVGEAHKQGLYGKLPFGFVSMIIHAHLETTINYAIAQGLSGRKLKNHLKLGAETLWQGIGAKG